MIYIAKPVQNDMHSAGIALPAVNRESHKHGLSVRPDVPWTGSITRIPTSGLCCRGLCNIVHSSWVITTSPNADCSLSSIFKHAALSVQTSHWPGLSDLDLKQHIDLYGSALVTEMSTGAQSPGEIASLGGFSACPSPIHVAECKRGLRD
ncbi:hypothetical protein CC79DRAFT_735618 [Sarocladium strictum]